MVAGNHCWYFQTLVVGDQKVKLLAIDGFDSIFLNK